jgi:competence protein CoiA
VVIEVQASALTLDTINKRVLGYNKFNDPINIVWIIPLKEELGDATFRPRLYEWYLHSMYYGRVYYWIKGMGAKVIPVHFDKTDRWIPETSWYNEFGEEEVAGGYAKDYKTIVKPNFGEVCDLRNFKERRREEFIPENEKKAVPKCHIFMDRLKKWW